MPARTILGQAGTAVQTTLSFAGPVVFNSTAEFTTTATFDAAISVGTTAQTGVANRFRMLQSMAEIEQNVAQSLASGGTGTIVAFTSGATVNVNPDSIWASGTPTRLTAQIAGKYLVNAFVTFPINSNAAGTALVSLKKNGTTALSASQVISYPTGLSTAPVITLACGPISLAATDYLEVVAYQSSGISQTITTCGFGLLYVGE